MSRVVVSSEEYVSVESEVDVEIVVSPREVAQRMAGEIEAPYWTLPRERRDWWDEVCAAVIRAINEIDDAIVEKEQAA